MKQVMKKRRQDINIRPYGKNKGICQNIVSCKKEDIDSMFKRGVYTNHTKHTK